MTRIELAYLLLGASWALSAAVALAVLRDHLWRRPVRLAMLGVLTAGTVYAVLSSPLREQCAPAGLAALRCFSAFGLAALWWVVRELFEAGRPGRRSSGWAWRMALTLWCLGMVAPTLASLAWPQDAVWHRRVIMLVMLAALTHLLWMLVVGRQDDLDPLRRRLRLLLAAGGLIYVVAVLVAGWAGWRAAVPGLVDTAAALGQILLKLLWLWLTVGSPAPLARLQLVAAPAPNRAEPGTQPGREMQPVASNPPPAQRPPAPQESVADVRSATALAQSQRHAERIQAAMEAGGLYRRPRLSMADLAREVGLPEHRVRAIVNGHLGYRNFTAYVNHFRLRAVAQRLRDPRQAHLPILTIALDEGYASLGPFNRAFREAFGRTPSDYRLAPESAVAPVAEPLAGSGTAASATAAPAAEAIAAGEGSESAP